MADDYELGTVGPIPTVNPNVAKIGEFLNAAKTYANQYYVKDQVPLLGGTQLGDFLLGQAPEEIQRWGQGDYPVRNPSDVVKTGGNRADIWKSGRFEPTFDVAAMAAPTLGKTAEITKGLPVGLSIKDVTKITPTLAEYEAMVGKGKMRQARTFDQDLKDTLSGKVPGNKFDIPMEHSVDYESGDFTKRLEKAGLHVYDDKYGTVFVGKTPKDLEVIKNAETPIEHGLSYGYSPEDIAKFYTNRRGGRADIGYAEYIDDLKHVQNKYPEIQPKASVEVKSIPQSEIDELGFHSPLENAILKIQQPKGTGDQFLKQLEKTPGVKTEELDVTGVKQYLLDHPNVTKQELLDHMKNSRLKLENKVLGEVIGEGNIYEDYELRGGDVYHDQDYIDSTAEDLHHQLSNDADIYHQEQEALVDRFPELYKGHENEPDVAARLNQHVEENIKELADTQAREMYYENPIRHYYDDHGYDIYGNDDMGYSVKDPNGNYIKDVGDTYSLESLQNNLSDYLVEQGILSYEGLGGAKYEDYTLPGKYTNYREVLTTHQPTPAIVKELPNGAWTAQDAPNSPSNIGFTREDAIRAWRNEQKDFESGHFDEPNILAHTRLNDRIINGKKTLMVEEIQSDWHQAGRKKGYQGTADKDYTNYIKDLEKRYENEAFNIAVNEGLAEDKAKTLATKMKNKMAEDPRKLAEYFGESEKQQAMNMARVDERSLVPDAPFKKNWHELMMKQILNEAVKGNYDAVAFTTGKQQAARYNLSKQIDSLELLPSLSSDDIKPLRLKAYKDGKPVISRDIDESELPDLIGKEAAKKLLEQPMGKMRDRTLSGVEMDVGGQGMKGFYDKILPDFVNKYTKKWGMGVRKANTLPSLQGEQVHMVDLTDAAKKDIKEKGQPLFSGIGLAAPALMPEDQDKTKK